MKIEVPDEIFGIKKFECEVISNNNVATFIKELRLKLPEGLNMDFRAGGYAQLYIPPFDIDFKDFDIEDEYKPDWDKYKVWDNKCVNDEEIFRLTQWLITLKKKVLFI